MDVGPLAFVFQTHLISSAIVAECRKIAKACQGRGTAWLLFQGTDNNPILDQAEIHLQKCSFDDIRSLGYPLQGPSVFPGKTNYPVAYFYKEHPGYAYYWVIEYDVRFSGSWKTLFNAFENVEAGLIAAHFARYAEEPEWPFWELSHPRLFIPLEQRWRCFQPIYRISNAALASICAAHLDGWAGHHEVLVPTLLAKNCFSFLDFGGKGRYVLPGTENRFYTARPLNRAGVLDKGTLRWRPAHRRTGLRRNKIYHPVKKP